MDRALLHNLIRLAKAVLHYVGRPVLYLLVIGVLVWAFVGMDPDFTRLSRGWSLGFTYLAQMFPPDRSILPRALSDLVVTVQMAIVGTFLGFIFALPISFLAARTSALPRAFSTFVKTCLNILRAVPSFIVAVLFVYMVGLGPFTGALGISVGSFVMLAKLFAETLESVHPAPIEAVKAVGGNPLQVFAFGMLPQALPQFLSHTLYAWELNIGAATIMGVVGAGGIGQELFNNIRYGLWRTVSTYVIVLVAMVLIADQLSYQVRKRYT